MTEYPFAPINQTLLLIIVYIYKYFYIYIYICVCIGERDLRVRLCVRSFSLGQVHTHTYVLRFVRLHVARIKKKKKIDARNTFLTRTSLNTYINTAAAVFFKKKKKTVFVNR